MINIGCVIFITFFIFPAESHDIMDQNKDGIGRSLSRVSRSMSSLGKKIRGREKESKGEESPIDEKKQEEDQGAHQAFHEIKDFLEQNSFLVMNKRPSSLTIDEVHTNYKEIERRVNMFMSYLDDESQLSLAIELQKHKFELVEGKGWISPEFQFEEESEHKSSYNSYDEEGDIARQNYTKLQEIYNQLMNK